MENPCFLYHLDRTLTWAVTDTGVEEQKRTHSQTPAHASGENFVSLTVISEISSSGFEWCSTMDASRFFFSLHKVILLYLPVQRWVTVSTWTRVRGGGKCSWLCFALICGALGVIYICGGTKWISLSACCHRLKSSQDTLGVRIDSCVRVCVVSFPLNYRH